MNIMLGKRVCVTCSEWAIIARLSMGLGSKEGSKTSREGKKEGFTLRYVVNKGRRASADRGKHAGRSWRMTEVVVLLSF